MKQKYVDYILEYISDTDINSMSDLVGCFCDEFDLKVKWSGLLETNQTFSKCLRFMAKEEYIKYAFTVKRDNGWGQKGGNLIGYTFLRKGYDSREALRAKRRKENE